MAASAAVIATLRAKKQQSEQSDEHARPGSPEFLKLNSEYIHVEANVARERLGLESDLLQMCIKMPNYILCVVCFLVALLEVAPATSFGQVQRHLENHFNLQAVPDIQDVHSIYKFMGDFADANARMQPTSHHYWCEQRYAKYKWDDHYAVPIMDCNSPRMGALGFSDTKWSSGSKSADSQHRRLTERRMASSGSESGGKATFPDPPCVDDDLRLQIAEDNPNITCALDAAHVCDMDLGLMYCVKTCGFCAPFKYDHIKRYDKPQVTMLPVVVYQTRFEQAECHDFAHTFEMQNFNPMLNLVPALDGEKHGRVLTCVDRTKKQKSSHALELDCPEHTPADRCVDGKVQITPSVQFRGATIYPEMLIEPRRDLEAMEFVEWIGVETDKVSISTLVYTEQVEIFTSLTVEFSLDVAGNIDSKVKFLSYRDLTQDAKDTFIACLLVTSVMAFVGVVIMIVFLVRHSPGNWKLALYELFSRALLCVYPICLLISWSQQEAMSHEYDKILNSFLTSESLSTSTKQETMSEYFKVKAEIAQEVGWLREHRVVSYSVCYVQFLQLVFYFNAHPRMAMLTSTVQKGLTNMIHFALLFGTLFLMLAFMSHWLLGGAIRSFETFGGAVETQTRMLFGEFIYVDGAEGLLGGLLILYWLYAVTFMIVVFFTLLNFFLAIIVDAFVDVKSDNERLIATRGFVDDICHLPYAAYMAMKYKIPSTKRLGTYFSQVIAQRKEEVAEHVKLKRKSEQGVELDVQEEWSAEVSFNEILEAFPGELSEDSLCMLLSRLQLLSDGHALIIDDIKQNQDLEPIREEKEGEKQEEEEEEDEIPIGGQDQESLRAAGSKRNATERGRNNICVEVYM
eukprot:TRINITY_DN16357_c0_g1_i4.p1 TRINITY_DN16357_c0_g1~~TRINITY_DN16357_c0_g1_i4.p1  ORF type:complete len:854 (+),score=141.78 TRINITY_DN16357_c0_g1_i4:42-2603(+)